MDFDSPDAAKEFPGLYLADAGKVDDSLEYVEDGDKKKSKKKKEKDKGYSALAGESSHDEEDSLDPKSPGKGIKIKAFSKLSGKKKEKDKKSDKSDKEQKKAEKEAKEKRKSEEKERKSMEKDLSTSVISTSTPGASAPRPQIPFSGVHLMKANSLNNSAVLTPQSSVDHGTPVKRSLANASIASDTPTKEGTPFSSTKPPKEKSAAFNVFLNAPAPLLSKLKDKDKDKDGGKEKHKDKSKDKEHKDKKHKEKDKDKTESKSKKEKEQKDNKDKDKSHASGMAKNFIALKLMRSKNSLEDPNEPPHVTSHQFPEDPEALAKEIKKYEGLLEQAHLQLKSTKKISKKQEEQLWELQRTLTQLKRKLRSINALSSASAYHVHVNSANVNTDLVQVEKSVSPCRPVFKKCDSIDGHPRTKVNATITAATTTTTTTTPAPPCLAITDQQKSPATVMVEQNTTTTTKENDKSTVPVSSSLPQEIPKIPLPPSKTSYKNESAIAISPPKLVPSPPKSVSPPPPQPQAPVSNEPEQTTPTSAEASKSYRNSIVLSTSPPAAVAVSATTTTSVVKIVPEPINTKIASPRPKTETIAQVHRSSISTDKSDTEEVQDTDNIDEDDDECINRRSISNLSIESSQVDSKESIEAVLDDANKMIGSMHEELMFEAAMDLVNGVGEDILRRSGDQLQDSATRMLGQDDSDVELFTNDLELELPNEEPCPDPFAMAVFDTTEYFCIENEALSLFNEQLTEDLRKEHNDLEDLLQKLPIKPPKRDKDSLTNPQSESDYNDLVKVWKQQKSENEILWDNVNRLRRAVAMCKAEEFRLQTRLKYIESKSTALSPVTTTTPLQTEG